ncbi:TetR family transcriptional regulator [Methylopila jiangsuensis]|uniref:TetR family transcriptional regulator n=1 Tax=Methylopila jiangsuensis TaxID=586230 RepID=A0A9W6N2Z2_9HYPH|nr:TetR/AcrR family transcriptional regulator [Methylopila jiangsuensis]MDR6285959.1 AcrR family transcriptional regulator [Methylopila jiangsuensis]GLK75716.1 TetR family transcriptional regulator [Methylopila jiangsuensis]
MVTALRDVFRAKGWDGASLSDLSRATGLSRAALYHHFPNGKADMAAAALDDVERRLGAELFAPLAGEGAPEARFARWLDGIAAYYRNGDLGCLLGALSLGQDEHKLRPRVEDGFTRWIEALARLADERGAAPADARASAVAVVALIQGALTLARATSSSAPFETALRAAPHILFGNRSA